MDSIPWIIIAIGVLLILLAVFAWRVSMKNKIPMDYYTLFTVGLVWLLLGIAMGISALWSVGLIFIIIGLAHRKEWKKNRMCCSNITEKEKRFKRIIIAALVILFLLGLVVFYLASKGMI